MPENWKTYKLGDLIEINKRSINRDFLFEEIEYIDTSSITENKLAAIQRLKTTDAPSRAKRLVKNNDIIYSTVRPIQRHYGFVKNAKPNTVVSTGFAVLTPKEIDAKFLYYYLSRDEIVGFLNGVAESNTTTFPAFNASLFESLDINAPESIEEQTRIAKILSALDEKIELNLEMNRTLERIAQATFKHWFVDFQFPGFDGEIVDGLPKDWNLGRLKDFGKIVCGKTPSKAVSEYFGGGILFIKIPDMHNSTFVIETNDSLTESGAKSQSNKSIPAYSICISSIATVGLVCINPVPCQTNQQINSIVPNKKFYTYYLYLLASSMKDIFLATSSGGTTTLNMNTTQFSNLEAVLPQENVLSEFHQIVSPMFDKILQNLYEIKILTQIRNGLLPKLISGKIRVAE